MYKSDVNRVGFDASMGMHFTFIVALVLWMGALCIYC